MTENRDGIQNTGVRIQNLRSETLARYPRTRYGAYAGFDCPKKWASLVEQSLVRALSRSAKKFCILFSHVIKRTTRPPMIRLSAKLCLMEPGKNATGSQ